MFLEIHLPIAIIVCEGDLKTIKRISAALENKLPIIIMKGSGKAADLVLDYLQKYFKAHIVLVGFSKYLTSNLFYTIFQKNNKMLDIMIKVAFSC